MVLSWCQQAKEWWILAVDGWGHSIFFLWPSNNPTQCSWFVRGRRGFEQYGLLTGCHNIGKLEEERLSAYQWGGIGAIEAHKQCCKCLIFSLNGAVGNGGLLLWSPRYECFPNKNAETNNWSSCVFASYQSESLNAVSFRSEEVGKKRPWARDCLMYWRILRAILSSKSVGEDIN